LHTRYQQIAMLDTYTGELAERRLEHESGEARALYPDRRPISCRDDALFSYRRRKSSQQPTRETATGGASSPR
jgi:hypothetical protein